jgi:hypothetical protein
LSLHFYRLEIILPHNKIKQGSYTNEYELFTFSARRKKIQLPNTSPTAIGFKLRSIQPDPFFKKAQIDIPALADQDISSIFRLERGVKDENKYRTISAYQKKVGLVHRSRHVFRCIDR